MILAMTAASQQALEHLRDPSLLQWYVVPLLSTVFYIYTREVQEARRSGAWEPVIAGATLFGMDFVNENVNGWILNLTGRSALWTTPGNSALKLMVGWNIEIAFMFAIAGIVFWRTVGDDPRARILGLPEKWFWALAYSAICVCVELVLHAGGIFVWEYEYWNASLRGVPLIFLFGYFHFYAAVILVLSLQSQRARAAAVGGIYAVGVGLAVVGGGVLGYRY